MPTIYRHYNDVMIICKLAFNNSLHIGHVIIGVDYKLIQVCKFVAY